MTATQAIIQALVAVFGFMAIWLTVIPRPTWRRWACVPGLAAQPLWLYSTAILDQWGMFCLALHYTAAWCFDAWVQWRPIIAANRERRTWTWLAHLWRGR
jgi:hypothetical protein